MIRTGNEEKYFRPQTSSSNVEFTSRERARARGFRGHQGPSQSRPQSLRYPCPAERFPVPLDKNNDCSGDEIGANLDEWAKQSGIHECLYGNLMVNNFIQNVILHNL